MRGATVAIINAITIYCSPCYNNENSHVIKKPKIILVGDSMPNNANGPGLWKLQSKKFW